MGSRPIDPDLGKHRKTDLIFSVAERGNSVLVPGLLLTELITGETEHLKTPRGVSFIQPLQTGILPRIAAMTRRIDDQKDFTPENRELDCFTRNPYKLCPVVDLHIDW